MTPLYHDLAGETVVVFGGGAVGSRKARGFDEAGRIVVVSPEFAERLRPTEDETTDTDGPIELVRAAPDADAVAEWIDRLDPALAVAATDDAAVNAAVEAAALDRGILVNRTDVSGGRDPGSVVVPATVEDHPVTVALSTGGTSPALAKA
ncbi:siroheme synthase, partial [Halorubrum ezzemoulense]